MKKFLLAIAIFFWALKSFGCFCNSSQVNENFVRSEFVAVVKIKKVYPNSSRNDNYYRIDFEIVKLFKGGKIDSLYVYGSSDGIDRTSCDMDVKENTKWLVYATRNENEKLSLYSCTSTKQMDRVFNASEYPNAASNYTRQINNEIKQLNFLRKKALDIQYDYSGSILPDTTIRPFLRKYDGIRLTRQFAQYLITFDEKLHVKSIVIIRKFEDKIDKVIVAHLSNPNTKWFHVFNLNNRPKDGAKLLFGLYYYNSPPHSIISQYTF